jgi:Zn-finger nucleic acid-binding protein
MQQHHQPCPTCGGPLEVLSGRHGLVHACIDCQAGATTLAVLKKVAPRDFINHVWQSAQRHGVESARICPSCARPLLETQHPDVEITPHIDVCLRCYLVWLNADALALVPVSEPRPAHSAVVAFAVADAQGASSRVFRRSKGQITEAVLRFLTPGSIE